MKHKIFTLLLAVGLVASMLLPSSKALAAGASISLVANKATVSNGGSLVIAVYMNGGGTPINAIQADLNYPDSKLQYVGVNFSGGAFEIGAAATGGGGGVSISRGTTSPVSGSALVATVTFKGLSSTGSASIGVSGSSSLVSATDNTAVAFYPAGTSVNFGVVATSSGTSSGAASAPAAPAPPKDAAAPVITAIKLSNLSPYAATVTWATNEPSDSVVEFGLDTNYGLSNSTTGATTTHTVTLSNTFLTPETSYHYRVKSTDGAGNIATSTDQSFTLPGIPVTIVVRGPNGKPQAGALVTIDNASGTTDSNGKVTLPSGVGTKKVTTVYGGVTVQKPITIERGVKSLPPYQMDLSRQPLNRWVLVSIGLFVVIISLLAIDALLFGSHFFMKFAGLRHMEQALLSKLGNRAVAPAIATPTVLQKEHIQPLSTVERPHPVVDDLDIAETAVTDKAEETTAEPAPQNEAIEVAPIIAAKQLTTDVATDTEELSAASNAKPQTTKAKATVKKSTKSKAAKPKLDDTADQPK